MGLISQAGVVLLAAVAAAEGTEVSLWGALLTALCDLLGKVGGLLHEDHHVSGHAPLIGFDDQLRLLQSHAHLIGRRGAVGHALQVGIVQGRRAEARLGTAPINNNHPQARRNMLRSCFIRRAV